MVTRKSALAFLLLACFARGAFAAGAGTSAVSTLKLDGAARPLALGGAYAAVADDANAVFYNPAGLAQIDRQQVFLTHTQWIADTRTEYAAYALPLGPQWTLGAGLNYVFTGDITRYDSTGNKTGTLTAGEGYGLIGAAYRAQEKFAVGANAKFVRQTADDMSASAAALDFGGLYMAESFRFAAAVQNLGTKMKLANESFSLPLTVCGGASVYVVPGLLVSAEVVKPNDENTSFRAGTEYTIQAEELEEQEFSLRAGWRSGQSDGAGSGISLGIGVALRSFSFDYGFLPGGDLGNAHKISVGFAFGPGRNDARAARSVYGARYVN